MGDKSKFDKFLIGRKIIKTADNEFEFELKENDTKDDVRSLIQNQFEAFMDKLVTEEKQPTLEELEKSDYYPTFQGNTKKILEKAIEKKVISEDDKKAFMTEYGIKAQINRNKMKVDGKYDMIYMWQMMEVMKDKGYDKNKVKEILMDSGVDEETATKQTDLMFKEKTKTSTKAKFKNEVLVQTESGVRDSILKGAEEEKTYLIIKITNDEDFEIIKNAIEDSEFTIEKTEDNKIYLAEDEETISEFKLAIEDIVEKIPIKKENISYYKIIKASDAVSLRPYLSDVLSIKLSDGEINEIITNEISEDLKNKLSETELNQINEAIDKWLKEENVEGIEASSIKAEMKFVIGDIDAGDGVKIDLHYDPVENQVLEERTGDDNAKKLIYINLDDFDPENYGEAGEQFLEKVDAMKSEGSSAESIIKKELELLEAAEKELFQKDWVIYNLEKGNILCMSIVGKDKDWKLVSWINLENNVSIDMDRILDFRYDSMLKAAKQKEDKYIYAISNYSFDPEKLKAYFLKFLGEDKFAGRHKVDIEINKDEFEKEVASIIGKPDIQGSDDFKKNISALEALMAATGADERLADEDKQYEEQLAKGAEVESEHKDTVALIKKKLDETGKLPSDHEIYESIAKDHIIELPDYYDKLAKMESGSIESDDKLPKEPEKDIFDLTEGVQLGDGLTLYKDIEKDEVYVNDKEGKELFRAPNVLKDDMVKIIEFMRIVLKMDEEEPEKEKKPDESIAKQPGEKKKPEEPLLPEQETDDATKEELAKMKEEIDKKKKKVKEIVEKVNNTNQLNVSKEEIQAQIRAGERNPIFAKRRAIEEKNKKLTLTLYAMDDKAMHIIESALIKNEKSDELNNLLNL